MSNEFQCFSKEELDVIGKIPDEHILDTEEINELCCSTPDIFEFEDLHISDGIEDKITSFSSEFDDVLTLNYDSDSIIADYEKYSDETSQCVRNDVDLRDVIPNNQILANCKSIGLTSIQEWQAEFINYIVKGNSLIISSAKSSGKSLLIELSLAKLLSVPSLSKTSVLLIFPDYTTLQNTYLRLRSIFQNVDVTIKFSEDLINIPFHGTNNIILSIYDKANFIITRINEYKIDNLFSTVVLYDIHLIGSIYHSSSIGILLSKLIYLKKNFGMQFIGLSAYELCPSLINLTQSQSYSLNFGEVERNEYFYIKNDIYQNIPDTISNKYNIIEKLTSLNTNLKNSNFPTIACIVIDYFNQKATNTKLTGGILIYSKTKYMCEFLAQYLVEVNRAYKFSDMRSCVDMGLVEYKGELSKIWLQNGIFVYHSGLKTNMRRCILNYYRNGTISILISTSVLYKPNNLPISRIIIDGLSIRGRQIDRAAYRDLKEMVGNHETNYGEVYLVSSDLNPIKELVDDKKCITCNGLTDSDLARLFLEILFMKIDSSTESLLSIYHNTINYQRIFCERGFCESMEIDKEGESNIEVINNILSILTSSGMIMPSVSQTAPSVKTYAITKLGNALIRSNLPLDDGSFLWKEISKTLSCLVLTSDIQPYYLLSPPTEYGIDWEIFVKLLKQLTLCEMSLLHAQFGIDVSVAEHMLLKQKCGSSISFASKDIETRYKKLYIGLINIYLKNNGIKYVERSLKMPYFKIKYTEKLTNKYANAVVSFCYNLEELVMHKILLSYMIKMGSNSFIWSKLQSEHPVVTRAIRRNLETFLSVKRSGVYGISKLLKKNAFINDPEEQRALASAFLRSLGNIKDTKYST